MADPGTKNKELVLSLISHTNVGKTALARTLLRRDVGEVADRAHVTVVSEAYRLIEADGAVVKLWDTPGFGSNLAKLAKRLRSSNNPVGWILHQVWDRLKDESLWCSQEAIRNIQADADVVIYLVDALQSPEAVGYVDLEMEILDWIGKPVLVYLNQVGSVEKGQLRTFEEEWRAHFKDHEVVKNVATLDAFTRCWVQEHQILERAAGLFTGAKKKVAKVAAKAWMEKNRAAFEESMDAISELASFALRESESLKEKTAIQKLWPTHPKEELKKAQENLETRIAEVTSSCIARLIQIQNLDGKSAARLEAATDGDIDVKLGLREVFVAAGGGALAGALGGIGADALAGGLTLGGGILAGVLGGGLGGFLLAKGFNLAQSDKNRVRWSHPRFVRQIDFILGIYLAISHFGRGRGDWKDDEGSAWIDLVEETRNEDFSAWEKLWREGGKIEDEEKLRKLVRKKVRRLSVEIFEDLYPESERLF